MKLNRLLNRQVLKWLPEGFSEKEEFSQFIKAINNSYNAYERDIELLNHAFRINEEEYSDINKQLKEEIGIKQVSISKLKDSILSISSKDQSLRQENDSEELLDIVNYLDEQINKRKQAEQIYTSLIKNLQSGILLEDETRHIIFANQLFCDMFAIPFRLNYLQVSIVPTLPNNPNTYLPTKINLQKTSSRYWAGKPSLQAIYWN